MIDALLGLRFRWVVALFLLTCPWVWGQVRGDPILSKSFYKGRRDALRALLPERSAAIFFASPVRNRSNDSNYPYHPHRDLFYLTGYTAPQSVLVIFKEPQQLDGQKERVNELLFTCTRSERSARYDGAPMTTQEVVDSLGLSAALLNTDFGDFDLHLRDLEQVLIYPLPLDVYETHRPIDLYDLIESFKQKVGYPSDYKHEVSAFYEYINSKQLVDDRLDPRSVALKVEQILEKYPTLSDVPEWKTLSKSQGDELYVEATRLLSPNYERIDSYSLGQLMTSLRERKTEEEIQLLRRAIDITSVAHCEVMRSIRPGLSEREVQGIHEYIYKKYGAAHTGFSSIVGSGHQGCILHYIKNNEQLEEGELILMDLGAEYNGYTADITRTIPVSGTFSSEQRILYEIVLEAQERALSVCKPGTSFRAINEAAHSSVAEGLQQIGLISDKSELSQYLPHGVTHHIGLDVHDKGHYTTLAPGMVITIEPGVYVQENSPCDKKWWGIGIRIEDDILITPTGYELLSTYAPRRVEEIEEIMRQPKRFFHDYRLPSLDSLSRTKR